MGYTRVRYDFRESGRWIRVVDHFPERYRYLYFHDSPQGALALDDPAGPVFEYVGVMSRAALALLDKPELVLFGGLGACSLQHALRGSWPRSTRFVTWEYEPEVIQVARNFFRLDAGYEVHQGDIREGLERMAPGQADAIMVDCYSAAGMPAHLKTIEFMYTIDNLLSPRGLAIFNIWSSRSNRLCGSQLRTMLEAFGEIGLITCTEDDNLILLARKDPDSSWPAGISFKGLDYGLRRLDLRDAAGWPEYMREAAVIEDGNLAQIQRLARVGA